MLKACHVQSTVLRTVRVTQRKTPVFQKSHLLRGDRWLSSTPGARM